MNRHFLSKRPKTTGGDLLLPVSCLILVNNSRPFLGSCLHTPSFASRGAPQRERLIDYLLFPRPFLVLDDSIIFPHLKTHPRLVR